MQHVILVSKNEKGPGMFRFATAKNPTTKKNNIRGAGEERYRETELSLWFLKQFRCWKHGYQVVGFAAVEACQSVD
jgi:hypothetical protein